MPEREASKLRLSRDEAEIIALKALGFLVSSPDRAERFLNLSGLAPEDLRSRAGDPHFLAGVIEHLLADESLLVMFAEDSGTDPRVPVLAGEILRDGRNVV